MLMSCSYRSSGTYVIGAMHSGCILMPSFPAAPSLSEVRQPFYRHPMVDGNSPVCEAACTRLPSWLRRWPRDFADVFDEEPRHRADDTILQSDDFGWPTRSR